MSEYESEFESYRRVEHSPEAILQEAIRRARHTARADQLKTTPPPPKPKVETRTYTPQPLPRHKGDIEGAAAARQWPKYVFPINHIGVIAKVVAARRGITMDEMRGESRRKPVALARQIAQYIAFRTSGRSSPEIAKYYSRDHSTVLHATYKIERMILDDPEFRAQIDELRAETDARKEVNKANGQDHSEGVSTSRPAGMGNQASQGCGSEGGEAPSQCSDQTRAEAPLEAGSLTTKCS